MFKKTILGIALMGLATSAEAETLRFGLMQVPGTPVIKAAERFAELVDEYTGGELTIRLFPAAQLGGVRNLVSSVKTGALDIGEGTFPLIADIVPDYNIYNAGYFYDDWTQLEAVINAEQFGKTWDEEVRKEAGIRVITAMYYGTRNLTTNDLAVKTPADLKGKKIRSVPNEMSLAVVTGLGANPTPVPFTDLFQALSQGVVDGQENPLPTIQAERFYEVQNHLILTNHQRNTVPFLMNDEKFQSLSPEHQDAILRAGIEAGKVGSQATIEQEKVLAEKLAAEGMTIVTEADGLDIDAFRESVRAEVEARFDGKIWREGLADEVLAFLQTVK